MKISSAILAKPMKLAGASASCELPGDAKGVELTADYEKQQLEVRQDGKVVTLRSLAFVVDMVPAPDGEKCETCGKPFATERALSGHRAHCGKSA